MLRLLPWPLLFLLSASLAAQDVRFVPQSRESIERRLDALAVTNSERAATMRKLFHEAGCGERLSDAPVRGAKLPNVVCDLPGERSDTIVVGAHYDKTGAGQGAIDNWAGVSLLPALFESLADEPRNHTFIFIAFAEEESGLLGSHSFVRHLGKDGARRVLAMVNLDSLGLGPTKVGITTSSEHLVRWASAVSRSMKLPLEGMSYDQVGRSDSASFRAKKIPTIDFHSVTTETLAVLHSKEDRLDRIARDDFFESYRLIAAYLALLDTGRAWPAGK
ncbi:MAG: M28 family peptidase [Bryobacterales bacterium]|jgi:Zn-dependent M28 family amino/carboxypeptidase|nr:M28 family peptidase [Bryobacterales bacterium]